MLNSRGEIDLKFRAARSPYLTEVAWLQVKTSLAAGAGLAISCSRRTSGGPYSVYTIVFIIVPQRRQ